MMQTGQALRLSGSDKTGIPLSCDIPLLPCKTHAVFQAVVALSNGSWLCVGWAFSLTRRYMTQLLHEVWTGGAESESFPSSSEWEF